MFQCESIIKNRFRNAVIYTTLRHMCHVKTNVKQCDVVFTPASGVTKQHSVSSIAKDCVR